ncbi:MAG: S4 domain-containing protein [candidate division Zixibacteria bacterium]|nr:S4 domain-containing protein [candidate division Zixibacteria bacterium]
MRIDDFLSTVGIIKRRTVAKELARNRLVHIDNRPVKPAYNIKVNDIISIRGTRPITVEVLDIPTGSVSKENRGDYFRELPRKD